MTKEELFAKAMELLVEAKEEKKTELGYLTSLYLYMSKYFETLIPEEDKQLFRDWQKLDSDIDTYGTEGFGTITSKDVVKVLQDFVETGSINTCALECDIVD